MVRNIETRDREVKSAMSGKPLKTALLKALLAMALAGFAVSGTFAAEAVRRPELRPGDIPVRTWAVFLEDLQVGSIRVSHFEENKRWKVLKSFVVHDPFQGPRETRTTSVSTLSMDPVSYVLERFTRGEARGGEEANFIPGDMVIVKRRGDRGSIGEPSVHQAPRPFVLEDMLPAALTAMAPRAGENPELRVFDVSLKGVYPVATSYSALTGPKAAKGASEVPATAPGAVSSPKWLSVDPVLRAIRTGLGGTTAEIEMTWDNCPVGFAARGFSLRLLGPGETIEAAAGEFDPDAAIPVENPPSGAIAGNSRSIWKLETRGLDLERLVEPCEYQRIKRESPSSWIVTVLDPETTGSVGSPEAAGFPQGIEGSPRKGPGKKNGKFKAEPFDRAKWLAPEEMVRCDLPDLQRAALGAQGKTRDPARMIRNIMGRIHGKVESAPGIPFRSASEVLADPRGDCTERAVLMVAFLRSRGIPSRAIYGLTYDRGGMHHHMWVEAMVKGRWIPADPTENRFPAGPGRLRLATVGLDGNDFSMIARLILSRRGGLSIEYIGTEDKTPVAEKRRMEYNSLDGKGDEIALPQLRKP